jgi:hypothetical protein
MRKILAIVALFAAALPQLNVSQPSPVQVTVALPAGTNTIGSVQLTDGTNTKKINPCEDAVPTSTPFSLASTTSLKLVSNVSSKQVYICGLDITVAGANNVALIEGTKTATDCDTSTAGMAGGTTAATGFNFAANGGLTKGNGAGVVYATATANHEVCLLASASTQVSGSIQWVQQ